MLHHRFSDSFAFSNKILIFGNSKISKFKVQKVENIWGKLLCKPLPPLPALISSYILIYGKQIAFWYFSSQMENSECNKFFIQHVCFVNRQTEINLSYYEKQSLLNGNMYYLPKFTLCFFSK